MDTNLRLLFLLMLCGAVFCQTQSMPVHVLFVMSTVMLGFLVLYRAFVSRISVTSERVQKRSSGEST